jgi:hypothetical protein
LAGRSPRSTPRRAAWYETMLIQHALVLLWRVLA